MRLKRDTTNQAFDVLTDLTLSPSEALRRFNAISRRWSWISRRFILYWGERFREVKQQRLTDESALAAWADDGGRA